jgi:hypothetical protein
MSSRPAAAEKTSKPKLSKPAHVEHAFPSPRDRALALATRVGFNPSEPIDLSAIDPIAVVAALHEGADILVDGIEEEIGGALTQEQLGGIATFLGLLGDELSAIAAKRAAAAGQAPK